MLNAEFIGELNIPGEYRVIDSIILNDDLFILIDRGINKYQLYRVDLDTAAATLVTIREGRIHEANYDASR